MTSVDSRPTGGRPQESALNPVESPRSVLERLVSILDAFSQVRAQLSLSELVEHSGLPKSTVHRLAEAMVQHDWLERNGSRYCIGVRMFELGGLVEHRWSLREAALPFMEDLYEATHEVVHLGVLQGTEVLYIDKIGGHRSMQVPSRVGGKMPAHCTGLGKALLAHSPPSVVREILNGRLRPITPHTIVAPNVLIEELSQVSRRGYATDREEAGLGMSCVAVPIVGGDVVYGAISITGPSRRIDPDRLAPAVRTAALGISRMVSSGDLQAM